LENAIIRVEGGSWGSIVHGRIEQRKGES